MTTSKPHPPPTHDPFHFLAVFFAFLTAAHRLRCAAAIRSLPAALIGRFCRGTDDPDKSVLRSTRRISAICSSISESLVL
jgi:hypothetical protein